MVSRRAKRDIRAKAIGQRRAATAWTKDEYRAALTAIVGEVLHKHYVTALFHHQRSLRDARAWQRKLDAAVSQLDSALSHHVRPGVDRGAVVEEVLLAVGEGEPEIRERATTTAASYLPGGVRKGFTAGDLKVFGALIAAEVRFLLGERRSRT